MIYDKQRRILNDVDPSSMPSYESVVQNFTKIRRRVLYFCYTDIGVKVVKC
jgi:hypothetical protein